MLVQKSQLTQLGYAVGVQYAVDIGAKRSTHTVDLVNMGGGDRYHTVGYAVGTQYAVGVSAKKVNSHHGLSKYGWWGPLHLVQKQSNPRSGVHSMQ